MYGVVPFGAVRNHSPPLRRVSDSVDEGCHPVQVEDSIVGAEAERAAGCRHVSDMSDG